MDGKPSNFNRLLKEIPLSQNTLRPHLDYLVEETLVRREKTRGGGRGLTDLHVFTGLIGPWLCFDVAQCLR
jgi:hypothetical protein